MNAANTHPATAAPQAEPESRASEPNPRALASLLGLASAAPSRDAFIAEAVRTIARHFAAPAASAAVAGSARDADAAWSDPRDPTASDWLRPLDALLLEVKAEPRTVARLYRTSEGGLIALVAAPIPGESNGIAGAYATVARCPTPEALNAVAAEADAVAVAVGAALASCESRTPARAEDAKLAQTIERSSAYADLTEFAFALTNNLRNKLGAEAVVLGLPRKGQIRIAAISGLDDVKARSPGTAVISQALEEAADLRRTICSQRDDQWNEQRASTGHRLQRAWRDAAGGSAVLSIPLIAGTEVVAVVGIRAAGDQTFRPQDIEAAETLLAPFAAAIPVVDKASRGVLRHAKESAGTALAAALAPRAFGRKAAGIAVVAAFVWIAFGSTTYRVAANTTLAATEITRLTAPFEGPLAEVYVEPGQRVAAGEPIFALDTEPVRLERSEVIAELRAHTLDADLALATGDHAAAALAEARADLAGARLATLDARIASAVVVAPADGVLLSGDSSQRLGEVLPLGEPLFDFTPRVGLEWEIHIPEHAADDVTSGMTVAFAPSARPDEEASLVIRSLAPAVEVRDGHSVLVARASAERETAPDWLRPGMSGVARIDAGERPVWWVAFHRITDALHMTLNRWR